MRRWYSWLRFLPVFLALAATAVFLEARNRNEILPPHTDLASLPAQLGNWNGTDLKISPDELEVLGPGQFLVREYIDSGSERALNLFIAFFPSQRSGDTIHSPKNCIPGSGWAPTESGRVSLQGSGGSTVSINRYIIAKGNSQALVLYWYQSHGKVSASEYRSKIILVTDAIRLNRTDGALIRVVVPISGADGVSQAQTVGLEFVHRLLPSLDNYIPR